MSICLILAIMIAIKNGKFFLKDELVTNRVILVKDGKIVDVDGNGVPAGYREIDARGAYINPGFIDLQIYGSGGHLFSAYPSADTLRQMDADLISKGTTGFLACVATNTPEVVHQSIIAAKEYRDDAKAFLGLHLEGPYLNAKRRGAHIEEYVRKASLEEVKRLMEHSDGTVKMMTIAAELQDDEVIHYLLDQGIVLSLGHSDATFDEATKAYNMGITSTTHLFNAMPSIHHRAPNLPVALFNHPTAMASIIADGNHVDFEVVKMSYKLMQERLFLITDAVTPCHIGPYQHQLSGDKFITADGTLSGSNITLLQAVQNCVRHCDVPLNSAFQMATLNPARLMKLDDRTGNLRAGCQADLLFLSDDLELIRIFKDGKEYAKV